jgi:hypothetical protein
MLWLIAHRDEQKLNILPIWGTSIYPQKAIENVW